MRLNNYRDPPIAEPSQDGAKEGEEEAKDKTIENAEAEPVEKVFNFAEISNKIIMATPTNPEPLDINLIVCHSEAAFALRKHIIERARVAWAKELKDISVNDVLSHTAKKAGTAMQMFEDQLASDHGFNLGESYNDTNIRIIYKTFLKQNDPRLVSPLEKK